MKSNTKKLVIWPERSPVWDWKEDDRSLGTESTHTDGKHTFHELYNAPDAALYMREMARVQYVIADHTSRVALKTMSDLFQGPLDKTPVVLELCSGYGLSMAPILTTLSTSEVLEHFQEVRPPFEQAIEHDRSFFEASARIGIPDTK